MDKDARSEIQLVVDHLKGLEADPAVEPYLRQIRTAEKILSKISGAMGGWKRADYCGLPFPETPEYNFMRTLAAHFGAAPFTSGEARDILWRNLHEGGTDVVGAHLRVSAGEYLSVHAYADGTVERRPTTGIKSRFEYRFTPDALKDLGCLTVS